LIQYQNQYLQLHEVDDNQVEEQQDPIETKHLREAKRFNDKFNFIINYKGDTHKVTYDLNLNVDLLFEECRKKWPLYNDNPKYKGRFKWKVVTDEDVHGEEEFFEEHEPTSFLLVFWNILEVKTQIRKAEKDRFELNLVFPINYDIVPLRYVYLHIFHKDHERIKDCCNNFMERDTYKEMFQYSKFEWKAYNEWTKIKREYEVDRIHVIVDKEFVDALIADEETMKTVDYVWVKGDFPKHNVEMQKKYTTTNIPKLKLIDHRLLTIIHIKNINLS